MDVSGMTMLGDMPDTFNLRRFVDAQNPVFDTVCAELTAGVKRTHWMWYVFPQIAGLGFSAMSRKYAISGQAEALAYLSHAILGDRLRHCARLVQGHTGRTAEQIFGPIDAAKFRSCMTLFSNISKEALFEEALRKYFNGEADPETLARLAG